MASSGWPNTAFSAAMRRSQARASSQPPPRATPLTAAIETASWASIADMSVELMDRSASSRPRARMALMSAPETKAFSPAPVTIRTPAAAFRTSSRAWWNSATVSESRALRTSGRLTVRTATRPSTDRMRLRSPKPGQAPGPS